MELIRVMMEAISIKIVLLLMIGVAVGIVGGALPGISSTTTAALVATFAYTMTPTEAIMFLAATQVGSTYGGSISASILNIPGTPASAATAMEAYPMAKRGDAQHALSINVAASFWGNTIGALLLLVVLPVTLSIVLYFGTWEMFWFSIFGLVVCAQLSRGEFRKGLFSGCLGLLVSFTGTDPVFGSGALRFTFGIPYLKDGIGLIPAMVGLYGMSEVFVSLIDYDAKPLEVKRSKWFAFGDIWKHKWLALRVSIIGFIVGVIPGVGANIASWVGYNQAQTSSKHPEKFGTGSVEGLIGSESANNACVPGAYAPMLALGVPGDGVTAIILAIFTVQGVQTGSGFMEKNPGFLYLLVLALIFAGLIFLLVGTFLSRPIVKVLSAPLPMIMAAVICLCSVGAFSQSRRYGDIVIMFVFGLIGLIMRVAKVPTAPMVLGIVIGKDLVDANYRRAMLAGKGSVLPFFTRPISIVLIAVLLFVVIKGLLQARKK